METVFGADMSMDMGCGINIIGDFKTEESAKQDCGTGWRYCLGDDLSDIEFDEQGAGYCIVAFIDNDVCKAAYAVLSKRWPILYQSPVRVNENTGNNFYFCVFDTKEAE